MTTVVAEKFKSWENELVRIATDFDQHGEILVKGNRNTIKVISIEGIKVNIKSFQIPNPINSVIYRYFRKSKARRSFEYANRLLDLNVGTPSPVAYVEYFNRWGLRKSFYMSLQLTDGFTFRELIGNSEFPEWEKILKQFTRFTFDLHERGIWFLDHSPGNTIIQKESSGNYRFFLVDLNRMQFTRLNRKQRLENFSRLSASSDMLEIIGKEYARLTAEEEEPVVRYIQEADRKFRSRRIRKKRLKRWIGK